MAFGCQKPYLPHIVAVSSNYLVVEGVINTGSDSTSIRLSRTVQLSSTAQVKPELGATVTVTTDAGGNYPLSSTGKGYYTGPGLNVNSAAKYGLKIVTSDGKVYQSDMVVAKNSPPIDSVYYRVQSDGLKIYADTHDPSHSSTYYRWDYKETYEIHSAFYAYVYFSQIPIDTVLPRDPANQIYACWLNNTSSDIILNSSAKLSKDVIANNQITSISSTSEKVAHRYSILVKQYALTADAFNYYQQLKKNTEQLGSIFDPQPSELPGNIHCVSNPGEAVIGYITAGSPAQSRIFIDNRYLPAWRASTPYDGCMMDTLYFKRPVGATFVNDVQLYIYTMEQMPIFAIVTPGSTHVIGYAASSQECVDCTLRGSNKQPDFWTTQ
ncbi:MAG TPA: DUF4249 domain-containing protein [Mucilaginibacter sp.]|jgi:hypothetical protein|nr:DUF4249 domain-containing protein [Mucilaginibacter sp.]